MSCGWRAVKDFFAAIGRGDGGSAVEGTSSHVCTVFEYPVVKESPMYDQSKLSELIRFARVDAGSIVMDVYPGDGDWTRPFSDAVGPEGRIFSFVPTEIADLKKDQVGRMRAGRGEGAWPRERRSRLSGPRGDAGRHATSGCPMASPILPRSAHRL